MTPDSRIIPGMDPTLMDEEYRIGLREATSTDQALRITNVLAAHRVRERRAGIEWAIRYVDEHNLVDQDGQPVARNLLLMALLEHDAAVAERERGATEG